MTGKYLSMKYITEYKIHRDSCYISDLIDLKDNIHEVSFSFGDMPGVKNPQILNSGLLLWEAQEKQLKDLKMLSENGIALNLLLNENCYGEKSLSKSFFNMVGDTVDYIKNSFGLASVTTTSPLIARFIHANFRDVETRASVKMRIGTVDGMKYVSEYFDGYCLQREINRDFDRIRYLKRWCDKNGKTLYGFANSGCLNNCSAQTFHENLISHEAEIAEYDNVYGFSGICREYLKDQTNYITLYDKMNFIRPEDISKYDEYFTAIMLASRQNSDSVGILKHYIDGKYSGNILEILEPRHSIYPFILENGEPPRIVRIKEDMCSENSENIWQPMSE